MHIHLNTKNINEYMLTLLSRAMSQARIWFDSFGFAAAKSSIPLPFSGWCLRLFRG